MKKLKLKKRRKLSRDDLEITLLALPTAIWFLLFAYLPMGGIIIAFKRYRLFPGKGFVRSLIQSKFIGLDNFKFLFQTSDAFIMIRNTLLYNFVFIVLGVLIPVLLAILISELHSKKLAKVVQTTMLLPNFLSWVVVGYIVFSLLSYDKGLLNQFLSFLNIDPVQWYMDPKYWPFILVVANIWKTVGYGMVVYLASISGIDSTYYEAALIDGASKFQQATQITLPLIKPIMIILFLMAMGRIFSSDFGLFYIVTRNSGQIRDFTTTIDTYVYNALMNIGNIGMSSAAAFFQSVFGCIAILFANWVVKKVDSENTLF